jgi:hypothetical protein
MSTLIFWNRFSIWTLQKRLGFVVACFGIFVVSLGLAILGHRGYVALLHDIVWQSYTTLSANLLMAIRSTHSKPEERYVLTMLTSVVTNKLCHKVLSSGMWRRVACRLLLCMISLSFDPDEVFSTFLSTDSKRLADYKLSHPGRESSSQRSPWRLQISHSKWLTHPPKYLLIYLWLQSHLLDLGRFFSFLILYTVRRTLWTGDQPAARPLLAHRTA